MSPDEKLEALRRDLDTDPKDPRRRSRFLNALVRAGHRERARALIREGFLCPWSWEDFKETKTPGVRVCDDCESNVYLALDAGGLSAHAAEGRCVVAGVDAILAYTDAQIRRVQDGSEPESPPPCVSEHRFSSRAFGAENIDVGLIETALPHSFVQARRALPICQEGDFLIVGFAEPPTEETLDDLALVLNGVAFEAVLIPGEEIDRAIDLILPSHWEDDLMAGMMIDSV